MRQVPTAIFWDYENVPLRSKDRKEFLDGLSTLFAKVSIKFSRIYCRKQTISESAYDLLISKKFANKDSFKWIGTDEKNAVDKILIQSCKSVLTDHKYIIQVILIAGDGDFINLAKWIKQDFEFILISQENVSSNLRMLSNTAYKVKSIAKNPNNWFKLHKRTSQIVLRKCELCSALFDDLKAYDRHMMGKHDLKNNTIYECHWCWKRFRTGKSLEQHQEMSHDD